MIIRPEGLMPAKNVQLEQQFEPGLPKSKGTSEQDTPERLPEKSRSMDPDSQNSPESNGGDHDSLS
jgi:hypothetical protein